MLIFFLDNPTTKGEVPFADNAVMSANKLYKVINIQDHQH